MRLHTAPALFLAICALVSYALISCALVSCAQVDGTGRHQLLLTSTAQENRLGAQAYAEVKQQEKPCTDSATVEFVTRVAKRVAAHAPDKGFTYEFTVLESSSVNAFCLPGGKIAVYTGILPLCRNEAGLAAVLGHEIAHAIARHGGERMSQQYAQQFGGLTLAALLEAKGVQPTTANMAMTAYGLGSQLGVMLPYSRNHELEADRLGLIYMAKAGYDPQEAVAFWQRFAALGNGGTPGFLSTHPASTDRAKALTSLMPEAQRLYEAAPMHHGAGDAVPVAAR